MKPGKKMSNEWMTLKIKGMDFLLLISVRLVHFLVTYEIRAILPRATAAKRLKSVISSGRKFRAIFTVTSAEFEKREFVSS